jgi:hypothetical protein
VLFLTFGEDNVEQSIRKLSVPAVDLPAASVISPGAGSALYVINLCASMAPIANAPKPLPGFEQYRIYQVSRKEDGRVRYRLRLGFFTDESEAATALACIREHYPTAFATALCEEDQRFARGFASHPRAAMASIAASSPTPSQVQPEAATSNEPIAASTSPVALQRSTPPARPDGKSNTQPTSAAASDARRAPAAKPAQPKHPEVTDKSAAPKAGTASAAASNTSSATTAAVPSAKTTVPSSEVTEIELSLAADPVIEATTPSSRTPNNEPFHVGKGVEIPASTLALSLESEEAKAQLGTSGKFARAPQATKPAAPPPQATTSVPVAKMPSPTTQAAPPKAVTSPSLPKPPTLLGDDAPPPDFDSTQTIRALTAAELDDETQPKWFAVQLAISEQPINLDTMPHLDIFAAYRLYSVASAEGGKILHNMRLGFFKEEVSAEAVCGYLKTFFANPSVLRVSVAEYERFSQAPRKPPVVETKATVIDLASARDRTPSQEVPVITMEVTNPSMSGRYPKPNTGNSGTYKQPAATKTVARSATVMRSAKKPSPGASGKHRSLQEALLAEAREVALSESAIRRLPKNNSLLSKLFGKK